jgi:outer membrane protein assembly factor BamA
VARLDARGYWKLTPEQFLSARLLAGRGTRGRLPEQEQFYAGGISTLRGHPYKAFRGDRQLLVNAEYAVDLVQAAQAVVFADCGRAWFDAEHPDGPRLPIDVGLGLQTRDERLRILFARNARDPDAPLFVTVRTRATF